MQDGPPSSRDAAKASVVGARSAPSGVRHAGVSTSAVGGKLTRTARSPSAETDASSVATEAGAVLPGDAGADDEVVLAPAWSAGASTSGPSVASASTRSIFWST